MGKFISENKERGFSLIELLISIVIFSIFIGSVFYFYSQVIYRDQKIVVSYGLFKEVKQFIDFFDLNKFESEGTWEENELILEWKATPLEEKNKITQTGSQDIFISLYQVNLKVINKSSFTKIYQTTFFANKIEYEKK